MWFIKITDVAKGTSEVASEFYRLKSDALLEVKSIKSKYKGVEVCICDGRVQNAYEDMQIGSVVVYTPICDSEPYGRIVNITSYLIVIEKTDGDIVELSKATFNSKSLKGLIQLTK